MIFTIDDYIIPIFEGPLVSYEVFTELQSKQHSNQEMEEEYSKYKNAYEQSKSEYYFKEHENEEWFKEKYDPIYINERKNQVKTQTQNKASLFFQNFQNCIYDNIKLTFDDNIYNKIKISSGEMEKEITDEVIIESNTKDNKFFLKLLLNNNYIKNYTENAIIEKNFNSKKTAEFYTKTTPKEEIFNLDPEIIKEIIFNDKFFSIDPDNNTIFLHQIPKFISSKQIFSVVSEMTGFLSMYLSEPVRSQNNIRYCWINFENNSNVISAIEKLSKEKIAIDSAHITSSKHYRMEYFSLHPVLSEPLKTRKINITPPIDANRLSEDIIITKKLIEKYDQARGITVSV